MVEDGESIIAALLATEGTTPAAVAAKPEAEAKPATVKPAASATPTRRFYYAAAPYVGVDFGWGVGLGASLAGYYAFTPTVAVGLGAQGSVGLSSDWYVEPAVSAIFGSPNRVAFQVGAGAGLAMDGLAIVAQVGIVLKRFLIQATVGIPGAGLTVSLGAGYLF